jgi:hypothetical protein
MQVLPPHDRVSRRSSREGQNLVHVGDCEQEWGSTYNDDSGDPPHPEEALDEAADQHRPPYLLTSIADETHMHP